MRPLRERPLPGLEEMNEAVLSVLLHGNDVPMQLIHRDLIVGEILGEVPEEAPVVPLQADLQREQRRLRLKPAALEEDLKLDLREPNALARSHLLHRLRLLDIPWGQVTAQRGLGTYWEAWRLTWKPEYAVLVVEASMWGSTVLDAATARTRHRAREATDLSALTPLLEMVLLAELPEAAGTVMERVQAEAAVASDVLELMAALPPLAGTLRYGSVRQTDREMVDRVVRGLLARTCIGLGPACASLDNEAAAAILTPILAVDAAVQTLDDPELREEWQQAVGRLADRPGIHGLVGGRCVRLQMDRGAMPAGEAARRLAFGLSTAEEPDRAAAWLEGFLRGSGTVLLHDDALWDVVDAWLVGLPEESFKTMLPLVRRTFATFSRAECRQLGEKARARKSTSRAPVSTDVDHERAAAVLPLLRAILGV